MKRTTILLLAASAGLLTACDPTAATQTGESAASSAKAPSPSTPAAPESAPLSKQPPAEDTAADKPPCRPENIDAEIWRDELGTADVARAPIVVINTGREACELSGYSKIEFMTGPEGRPLGIEEYTTGEPKPVVIWPGDKAWLDVNYPTDPNGEREGCTEFATFVLVTLPGDTGTVEAAYEKPELALSPVCGHVVVAPWVLGAEPS